MRKLPSSASTSNLRELVENATDAIYTSNGSSMMMPSSEGDTNLPDQVSSSDVAMSGVAVARQLNASTNMATPSMATSSMATSVATSEDPRGCKKSPAYVHTTFHELVTDDLGKSYERRTCNYCSAGFSFKGGTTSAALRHLKTAHSDRLGLNGVAPTSTGLTGQPTFQQVVENTQHLTEQPSFQDSTDHLMNSGENIPVQLNGNGEQDASSELKIEQTPRADMSDVMTVNGSEGNSSILSMETEQTDQPLKRKRGGSEYGDSQDSVREIPQESCTCTRDSAVKLTVSQEAILHFRHNYVEELPLPAMRLRFARHLTHNVAEAEMYNVLDPATQREYVREFAQPMEDTLTR